MLAYLQLHDICTWYDAVNVHDIVYVYENVAEYVYDIVCAYVDVYVLLYCWYGIWWNWAIDSSIFLASLMANLMYMYVYM